MKIAIVTGASSGMGREFVLQLSGHENLDESAKASKKQHQSDH